MRTGHQKKIAKRKADKAFWRKWRKGLPVLIRFNEAMQELAERLSKHDFKLPQR